MEDLYKSKFRTQSSRKPNWDYGSDGLYFVTICTKDRIRYFGEIVENDKEETQSIASLRETHIGGIALENWFKIPEYHPYVELDEFIVMPDHVHVIVCINKPEKDDWIVSKFGPQKNNLASIIRGYKSSVTQYAKVKDIEFQWQSKFHDRVIRTEHEYLNIKEYIYRNADDWFLGKDNFEDIYQT